MRYLKLLSVCLLLLHTLLYASEEIPTENEVAKLYVSTFNRAPDAAGLNYWIKDSHLMLSQIAQSFFDQLETELLYPIETSNHNFIKSVYNNLFNRDPDTEGWNYWEHQLDISAFSKNRFIEAVINGAQDSNISFDATILSNKASVGLYFSEVGLEDVSLAKRVMEKVSATKQSVVDAIQMINDNFTLLTGSDYGYYVDSPIQGIKYECGDNIGFTDVDGKFVFEKGLGCTFFLGNAELRTVDSSLLLTSGVILRETDIALGILLQSLDKNSDPEDGIEIPVDIQVKLEQANITHLPFNDDELREFINVVGGMLVSEEDAVNHMKNEKLKMLIIGKTFYFRNIDYITKISFSDTGIWTFKIENSTIEDNCNYVIKNGLIEICSNTNYAQTWVLNENTNDYITFNITYGQSNFFTERAIYFNRKIPDDELTERIGTYSLLANKTFYQYCYIKNTWSFVPIQFNTDKNITIGEQNKHYRLDPDYNLFINDEASQVMYPGGGTANGVPNYTNKDGVPIYMATEEDYHFYLNQGFGLINYKRGANFCNDKTCENPKAPGGVFKTVIFEEGKMASTSTCNLSYYLSLLETNNEERGLKDESFIWNDCTNACWMFYNPGTSSTFPSYIFQ